jgi:hypothetical protein
MRSNRRRNWLIKRIALGFAVAAFAAPVAQAQLDEGGSSGSKTTVSVADFGMPRAMPGDYALNRGDQIELVRSQPQSTGSSVVAGMPRAMPHDYALSNGGQIEVVRAQPAGISSDKIEFVRSTKPRGTSPELVIRSLPGHPSRLSGSERVTASNNQLGRRGDWRRPRPCARAAWRRRGAGDPAHGSRADRLGRHAELRTA